MQANAEACCSGASERSKSSHVANPFGGGGTTYASTSHRKRRAGAPAVVRGACGDDAARHAYPAFGSRQLGTVRPGEVQAWVKRLSSGSTAQRALAPATVAVVHGLVAAIFKAAVRDRKLPSSPCNGIKLPRREPVQVVPLATSAVWSLVASVPPRHSALVTLAAGTGLRQGEAFGLNLTEWTSCPGR